jgi:hypothetical protein
MMGHILSTYYDIEMKGIKFLRNVYAASSVSIRPETQASKLKHLKEEVRAWSLNPEEVLTRQALTRPCATYAGQASGEEEQVKSLSVALKEMMTKEPLNGNAEYRVSSRTFIYAWITIILQRFRGAGSLTWLRGRLNTVDPQNLTQVMLAEGKWEKEQIFEKS